MLNKKPVTIFISCVSVVIYMFYVISNNNKQTAELLYSQAMQAYDRKDYNIATNLYIKALEQCDKDNYQCIVKYMRYLGYSLANQHKFKEAEKIILTAIAISLQYTQSDIKSHFSLYYDLSKIYYDNYLFINSEKYAKSALDIVECNGELLSRLPIVYNMLGMIYLSQGKYDFAEECYVKVIESVIDNKEEGLLLKAYAYNNLADMYRMTGRYKKAESYFDKAYGSLPPQENYFEHLAMFNFNQGILYAECGNDKKAIHYYKKAQEYCEKTIGEENVLYAKIQGRLAARYSHSNLLSEAERLYKKSIDILRKVQGNQSPEATIIQIGLSANYEKQGMHHEAENLILSSLPILEDVYGKQSIYSALAYYNLGCIYDAIDDNENSLIMYEKAVDISVCVLGEDNIKVSKYYNNLAVSLCNFDRFEEAEKYFNKIVSIHKNYNLTNNSNYAIALNNLGDICINKGEVSQAELYIREALNIAYGLYGEDHPVSRAINDSLAELHNIVE